MKSLSMTIAMIIVLVSLMIGPALAKADHRYLEKQEIRALIVDEAEELGYPPALALAIARVSSNFNPRLIGRDGGIGVMQVTPFIAKQYGTSRRELYNPAENIRLGIKYLQDLEVEHSSLREALVAYAMPPRSGAASVRRHLVGGITRLSRVGEKFSSRVLATMWQYRSDEKVERIKENHAVADSKDASSYSECMGTYDNPCYFDPVTKSYLPRKQMIMGWESVYDRP